MGGNTKGSRRRFGAVRQFRSGRWQARYLAPDGIMRPADRTFATKTEAERWLTRIEAEIIEGDWIDPDAGRVPFGEYAADWIDERPGLRPKTIQLYRFLLSRYLASAFGRIAVADIREAQVRRWRGPDDDSLLSTSPSGSPLRHSNFRRRVWLPALAAAGLADVHFHDLRHAGNVLAAAAGANLRELMERMGHSTTRAAMIYIRQMSGSAR